MTDDCNKLSATAKREIDEKKHELYTGYDPLAPAAIKDRNGAVVLSCCKKCGLGESQLDDEPVCRGYKAFGNEALKDIDHCDQQNRDYIPLAGGYEFQTKGNGSSVRILCPDGQRITLPWQPPQYDKRLEDMIRAQHARIKELERKIEIANDYTP